MEMLPGHGPCFVCGTENAQSIGAQWYLMEDMSIYGQITLNMAQQGPPGHAHGGASAALLDEAMGAAVWQAGHMVMAANLNINYRRPVPLGVPVDVKASVVKKDGRKIHAQGSVSLPDGTVAVESTGLFIEARSMFAKFANGFGEYMENRG